MGFNSKKALTTVQCRFVDYQTIFSQDKGVRGMEQACSIKGVGDKLGES
jgi:hypothetical protein